MGLIDNVNVNVGGNGNIIDTLSTYVTKILRPNIVDGENVLTQEMMSAANTKYVIKYDYVLGEDITVPANCALEFDGGSISGEHTLTGNDTGIEAGLMKIFGADVTLAGTWNVVEAYPEWFGAKGDNITDNVNSFAALSKTPFINIKFKENAHYLSSGTVRFKHDVNIDGNNSTLKFTVDDAGYDGLHIQQDIMYSQLTNITSISAVKDEYKLTVNSTSGVSVGDMIMLVDDIDYSWSSERAYYKAGDIFEVSELGDGQIIVTEKMTQNYSGNNLKLFKLNTLKANIRNIEVIGTYEDGTLTKTVTPIVAVCCKDLFIDNIKTHGCNLTHIYTDLCYNVNISNVFCNEKSTTTGSNTLNYGIFIGSSKNVTISKCDVTTTRHAISVGGGHISEYVIPNRFIIVTDCILNNYSSEVACLDSHGNCQYYTVANCIIKNAVGLAASDFKILNNTIESHSYQAVGIADQVYMQGVIADNTISFNMVSTSGYTGGIVIINRINQTDISDITISGNVISHSGLDSAARRGGIVFVSTSASYIDGSIATITNNNFKTDSKIISVDTENLEFNITDNINLNVNLGTAKKYSICGNRLSGFYSDKGSEFYIVNNTIDSPFNAFNLNNNTAKLIMRDNRIIMPDITRTIYISSADYVEIENNNFKNKVAVGYARKPIEILLSNTAIVRNNTYNTGNKHWENNVITATVKVLDYGVTTDRPISVYIVPGFQFFDTTLGKPIYWTGSGWVEEDGATAGVRRSGGISMKPTNVDDVYIGFAYMTYEQGPIYVGSINGQTINWVDATGQPIVE